MNHDKASELAKKLFASSIGREVVSRMLNISLRSEDEQKQDENVPTIAVLVPCYEAPEPQMVDGMASMYKACQGHCNVYTGPNVLGSSVVHWTRNYLLADLIKTQRPWTHVLFLDDDIVAPPDALLKMLSHGKDIVAAVCTKRIDPPIPNIRYWDDEIKGFREIFDWPKDQLLEVGGAGTGMMLITRKALELVADAYFMCKYEKEVYGISDETAGRMMEARLKKFDENANGHWFRFLPDLNGTSEYGEDMSFCFIARRYCDLKIYADTSIRPKHIGKYGYSVDDYEPYKEQVLAKAKANGTYRTFENAKIERPLIEVIG